MWGLCLEEGIERGWVLVVLVVRVVEGFRVGGSLE